MAVITKPTYKELLRGDVNDLARPSQKELLEGNIDELAPMFRTTPQTTLRNDPIAPQQVKKPVRPSSSPSTDIYGAFDVWAAPPDSQIWKSPGADFVGEFGQGWNEATGIPALMGKKIPPAKTTAGKIGRFGGRMMEVVTELIGLGAAMRGVGLLSKTIPKGAWAGRALQTGALFGTQQITEEARKATAEAIYGEDFGSRGGIAVLESFALGAVLSLAGSGVGKVWSKLKPTEQALALKTLGLKKGASLYEINKAARREAFKYHPDKVKGMRVQFDKVIRARDALRRAKSGDVIIANAKQNFKKQLMGKTGVTPEVADTAIQRLDAGESVEKVDQMISQARAGIKPLVTAPTIPELAPTKPVAGRKAEIAPVTQPKTKVALMAEHKELYRQISEATKEERPVLEARDEKVIEQLNQIILEEFDPAIGKLPLPWQMKSSEIKVPGAVRTIPKPGDISGGVRIAMPSAREKGAWQVSTIMVETTTGEAKAFTHIEFPTKEGALEYLKNIHKAEVKEAIKQGKPVPAEVLAEYPDLAQPTPKPEVVGVPTPKKIKPEQIIRRPEGTIDADLPPVKEGYIRLYRGQHPAQKDLFHPKRGILTDKEIQELGLSQGKGGWFTPWLNYAVNYAEAQGEGWEIAYIDVPRTVADAHIAEKAPKGLAERGEAMEYYFPELREAKPEVAKVEKVKPIKPGMATQGQKAQAHIIAERKGFISEKGKMRPGYRHLAKAMTGQTSIAKMTEQQAKSFINALNRLPEPKVIGGKIIPPSIPRTAKLVPKGFAQRQFKRPTPISLITSNAYYAEKLGVKSLVEPLERAKMRFDLEHHSASNEIDRMGQKIDVLGKTTAKEKITAKVRNIPTKARAEMGDLLNTYEEAPASLDPKKKEIFNWFRNLSRTMLARQNEARAKLDLPLIKKRKAYMRHIATDISREMLAGKYPFPEGIGFWSGLNVGKKIFNPMEFQRKLEDDVYGLFTRDPVYASKAMMYNALKEIHLNQPLKFFNEQLSALGKDLPEYKNLSPRERAELDKTTVMPADTRRWLIDYVRTVIKGQQTNTDRLVNNIVNQSGLRGLLNTTLRPFGRTLSQRPVTRFFQGAGRVQMAGVMGPRPRLLIRNKFQLTQNLALYGTKANARAFLPPNKELKKLLDESLFLKSYTGLEELPADLAKKVEKLWHTAYQWTATSNARQAMEVAYWDTKELIDNPKYKKYGWKQEHLLKEMEFGASATQYQYNAIGMPGVFRHKSLIPATRLTSWWMNYFAKFHREALHRAFTGRPSWSGPEGPTLPWSRRLGWLRYAVLGGLILNTMGYTRSYMFGAAPTGWPPALQAASALYRYTIADDDVKRKAAKTRFYNAAKTFIPGYIAYKDFNAVWTGRKDLESLLFYEKKKKKD